MLGNFLLYELTPAYLSILAFLMNSRWAKLCIIFLMMNGENMRKASAPAIHGHFINIVHAQLYRGKHHGQGRKKIPSGPCHKSLTLHLKFHLLAMCNIHITLEKMRSTRRKLSFKSNLEVCSSSSGFGLMC